MFTKLNDPAKGILNIETRQFETGLYIIINNDPKLQNTLDMKEEQYHINVRTKCLARNGIILNGTVIKNYKGSLPINKFDEFITDVDYEECN